MRLELKAGMSALMGFFWVHLVSFYDFSCFNISREVSWITVLARVLRNYFGVFCLHLKIFILFYPCSCSSYDKYFF